MNQNLIKNFIEKIFRVDNNVIVEFFIDFKIQLLIAFFTFDKYKQQQKNVETLFNLTKIFRKKFFDENQIFITFRQIISNI